MRQLLVAVTEPVVVAIDLIALAAILIGTIEAVVGIVRTLALPLPAYERRAMWLRYARWLVAGLTFQLAADIVETSITTSWDALGRIAAVAAIRTFLNYFLERDFREMGAREQEAAKA